jgi:hypothetical protein
MALLCLSRRSSAGREQYGWFTGSPAETSPAASYGGDPTVSVLHGDWLLPHNPTTQLVSCGATVVLRRSRTAEVPYPVRRARILASILARLSERSKAHSSYMISVAERP